MADTAENAKNLGPPLPLSKTIPEKTDKTELVRYDLRTVSTNNAAGAQKYQIHVRKFNNGTVEEYITLREKLEEIFRQNEVDDGDDQVGIVRSILHGTSLTAFNVVIARNEIIFPATVSEGLVAVGLTVFPHRALEVQKLWMRRQMRKPYAMSYRIFDSEVERLNNSIKYFPMATNANLFTGEELLELLEWSIPQKWRAKFDLANYIPSKFNRARLTQECEAIERSEKIINPKQKKNVPHKKSQGAKHASTNKYCQHCKTKTHNTVDCFKLKALKGGNATAPTNNQRFQNGKGNFSHKQFQKEMNLLQRQPTKKRTTYLEQFSAAIIAEQKKYPMRKKKSPKKGVRKETTENSSDSSSNSSSEHSIHATNLKRPSQSNKNNKKEKPLVLSVGMTPVNPIMTAVQRIPRKTAVHSTKNTVCKPPVQEVLMDTQEEFVTLNDLLSTAKNRCKIIPTEVVVGNIPPQKRGAEKGLVLVPDTYKVPETQEPVPPVTTPVLVPPVEEQGKNACTFLRSVEPRTSPNVHVHQVTKCTSV